MTTEQHTPPVDWESAAWWARTLAPVGPTVTRAQAERAAAHLRSSAERAPRVVADITGLHEASEIAGTFPRLVVDRAGWAEANVAMFADITAGHLPRAGFAASQGAAIELGGLLGLMSTRILGQFDPFSTRLYLIAPNIVSTRRALRVDEADFAMWVALHEQTHAVQFAAAPWLREYLRNSMTELLQSMTADQWSRAWSAIRNIPRVIRGRNEESTTGLITELTMTDDELAHLERVTAAMSLLEGHADVVMDSAEDLLPATATIRKKFTRRREDTSGMQGIVRKILGMDAKLRQYTDGAAFVRAVLDRAGHEGVNLAFAGEANLPTPQEIANPDEWVARVVG